MNEEKEILKGRKREDDRIHVTLKRKEIYEGEEGDL